MKAITTYINDAIQELHHVRWPTRQQAIRLSIIVIGFVLACTVAFGALDYFLSEIITLLLSLL